jgi:uncharacterized protein
MGRGYLDYERMLQETLRGVARAALREAAERGLLGNHHFFISFRNDHPGVDAPQFLRDRYPEEMTIVLQNKFWGLDVSDESFSVSLNFNKVPAHLTIPFSALTRFVDPSVNFGLQLTPTTPTGEPIGPPPKSADAGAAAGGPADGRDGADERGAKSEKVVPLDSFRKS